MSRRLRSTGVASTDKSIKRRLTGYLESEHPAVITEGVWKYLLQALAPVSESYLRELLRKTGLPFDQPFAGVNQHTFEDLEASLCELSRIYTEALGAGDRERARYCRRQVLGARERAGFAAASGRTDAAKREAKQEMMQWMLVWLEDPDLFPVWLDARKRALAAPPAADES
jgi:hypothetical protein